MIIVPPRSLEPRPAASRYCFERESRSVRVTGVFDRSLFESRHVVNSMSTFEDACASQIFDREISKSQSTSSSFRGRRTTATTKSSSRNNKAITINGDISRKLFSMILSEGGLRGEIRHFTSLFNLFFLPLGHRKESAKRPTSYECRASTVCRSDIA